MHNYFSHILLLLKRLLIIIVLFQAGRLFFYFVNHDFFSHLTSSEIFRAFFFGTRFDITAIIYFNILFIILHLLPGNFKNARIYQNILKFIFIFVNAVLVLANLADSEYYQFTDKRTTADFFSIAGLGDDFISLLPDYIIDYWYILFLCLLLMVAAWFVYPEKTPSVQIKKTSPGLFILQFVLMLLFTALFITIARGVRLKPVRIITAAEYTATENIPLVLNTPFTVLTTIQKADLNVQRYYSDNELDSIYSPLHNFSYPQTRNFNVVIIILESFSKDYIGYYNNNNGYTPFLDSLIRHSLSFDYSFANGKRSIDGIPAILAGIPSLMDNAYITSQFCIDNIDGIASLLGSKGYHTSFFHGGTDGTMGFDYFTRIAGIEHYYGKSSYPYPEDFDGSWGIYDEPFLQYFAEQINNFPQPFFSCVFTLSSHHPYPIPGKLQDKFKGGNIKILKSIQYADFSLKRLFQTISKTAWFRNTLFVITADHTSQSIRPYYNKKTGEYSVPVLFYKPDDPKISGVSRTIIQHADIMPSILDYLNYSGKFICFGNSVFNPNADHFSINYNNNIYQLIDDGYVLLHDGEKSTGLFRLKTDSFLLHNLLSRKNDKAAVLEKKLKGIIQSYSSRLINNKMAADGK